MCRITIFTGKGGVGKTSIAAAHAVKSASDGYATLLVSTDMAHNLGDLFGQRIGNAITPVAEHLEAYEPDPLHLMQEQYPELNRSLTALVTKSEGAADKLSGDFLIPGTELLFCLLEIAAQYESGRYDRIIVDCAPTGETLALLKLPELLSWYMEKFFPVGKTMVRALSAVSDHVYHMELPSAEGLDDFAVLHKKLQALQLLLRDETRTRVRIVCTPEKMVVAETRRSYMYLNLYGYPVDMLLINRVLPEDAPDAFFKLWKERQQGYIRELNESFPGLAIRKLFWYPQELKGLSAIREYLLPALFSGMDADDAYAPIGSAAECYEKTADGYVLTIPVAAETDSAAMPVAAKTDSTAMPAPAPLIERCGQDLSVTICGMTRRLILPDALRGFVLTKTDWSPDGIHLHFSLSGGDVCGS